MSVAADRPLGLEPLLWEVLACPADHAPVEPDVAASAVACTQCGRRFPVRDGIPVMLLGEVLQDDRQTG